MMNHDATRSADAASAAVACKGNVRMIKCRDGLMINPKYVASMEWDRRHYFNGPGDTVLVIRMHDGTEHRVKHEPHYLGGADAYAVEMAIVKAMEGADV
jgi:hypothetical protein